MVAGGALGLDIRDVWDGRIALTMWGSPIDAWRFADGGLGGGEVGLGGSGVAGLEVLWGGEGGVWGVCCGSGEQLGELPEGFDYFYCLL